MAIDLDIAGIAGVRHSKRSIAELWDRRDAREALRVAGHPMAVKVDIAARLLAYATLIDASQVAMAIAYLVVKGTGPTRT